MQPLRIALTKGRLEKSTVALLEQTGMDCSQLRDKGRRLILPVGDGSLQAVLAKAADVITYVEHGVCDMGVVGKDTIMENGSRFFEILDLGFGRCGFALAAPKGSDFYGGYRVKTVATKYPNIAKDYFYNQKYQTVEIIKLNGSIELAPIVGLSEVIVDIVETGSTLRENGLMVLEEVCSLSARMVVNQVSMKTENERITAIIKKFQAYLKENAGR